MADDNTRMQIRLSPRLYSEIKRVSEASGANLNSTMCFLMTLGLGVFVKKIQCVYVDDDVIPAREDLAKSAEIAPE